jgi:hypothetical protein
VHNLRPNVHKVIKADVPRTLPDSTLFRNPKIQGMLYRVLYIWNMRNPGFCLIKASFYVQGINDLATPFFIVFLKFFI